MHSHVPVQLFHMGTQHMVMPMQMAAFRRARCLASVLVLAPDSCANVVQRSNPCALMRLLLNARNYLYWQQLQAVMAIKPHA